MPRNLEMYSGKVVLAPMVRCGTWPLRQLALKYGADLVWGQELVAKDVMTYKRYERDNGFIEFESPSKSNRSKKSKPWPVFRTKPGEKIIFQIGCNNPEEALSAAKVVESDVMGIDVNMGCPKHFSVHNGMGCGLLHTPEVAYNICKQLVDNLSVPVTAKIRLLPTLQETVAFCKLLESTGISALGVHARTQDDRRKQPARIAWIPKLVEAIEIPLIYNGDIFRPCDIKLAKELTKCSSVMIARGALQNCSLFSGATKKMVLKPQIIKEYLQLAESVDNLFENTKYTINHMFRNMKFFTKRHMSDGFIKSKSYEDLWKATDDFQEQYENTVVPPKALFPPGYCFQSFYLRENSTSSSDKDTESVAAKLPCHDLVIGNSFDPETDIQIERFIFREGGEKRELKCTLL